MKQFSEMNLKPELVEALKRISFLKPTEVQEQSIPVALEGKDIIVRAKTGTGKTGAFLIPILQKNNMVGHKPEVLIIVPTRELAIQIYDFAIKLVHNRNSVNVVYGGASINIQMQNLRRNPTIIIGTPGRLLDLMERNALRIDSLKYLVLDEADTMLDMGFIEDIETIISKTPHTRQTMLFSATMPQRIVNIARKHMKNPTSISIGKDEELIVTKIKHYYAVTENNMKFAMLMAYIAKFSPKKAIVFVQTQYAADAIHAALMEQGVEAMLIHGGLTQARREHSLREYKTRGKLLIATNVAARGIDIAGISDIINFDAPEDPNVYVHRVGRSARMNADGKAFTIVNFGQRELIRNIEYATNIDMEVMTLDIAKFARLRAFKGRGDAHEGHRGGGGGRFGGRRDHGGNQHYNNRDNRGGHGQHRDSHGRDHRRSSGFGSREY